MVQDSYDATEIDRISAIESIVDELEQTQFRPIEDIIADAPPLYPLWGDFLYRGGVTFFISDPGLGKTTFMYAMIKALSVSKPFLGIEPTEALRPVMLDYESGYSLINMRSDRLSKFNGHLSFPEKQFFIFTKESERWRQRNNKEKGTFPYIMDDLIIFLKKKEINTLIIDSQSWAFSTRDENDNPEALKQMGILADLAEITNVAIILIHHSSKADAEGTRKGSGAYARSRASDIIINITPYKHKRLGEDGYDVEIPSIRFEVAKNRYCDDRIVWFLEKDEGDFKVINQKEIPLDIPATRLGRLHECCNTLEEIMNIGKNKSEFWKMGKITNITSQHGEFSMRTTERAIAKLVSQGRIQKTKSNLYKWIA